MLQDYLLAFDSNYEPEYEYEAFDTSGDGWRSLGKYSSQSEAFEVLKSHLAAKWGGDDFDPDVHNGWQLRHMNSPYGKKVTSKVDGFVGTYQIK